MSARVKVVVAEMNLMSILPQTLHLVVNLLAYAALIGEAVIYKE